MSGGKSKRGQNQLRENSNRGHFDKASKIKKQRTNKVRTKVFSDKTSRGQCQQSFKVVEENTSKRLSQSQKKTTFVDIMFRAQKIWTKKRNKKKIVPDQISRGKRLLGHKVEDNTSNGHLDNSSRQN